MEKKRSVGIIAIGVIAVGIIMFIYGSWLLYTVVPDYKSDITLLDKNLPWIIFVRFCAGLLYIIASISILRLKSWSRRLVVYLSASLVSFLTLSFITGYIWLLKGHYFAVSALVSAILDPFLPSLLFLIFFIIPAVKEQFR